MFKNILSKLGEFAVWLLRWYIDRVTASWRQEWRRLRNRDNKWVWIGLSIFFTIFLVPYLGEEAFSDSLLLGLSFIWSTFLAVSFGYVLRHPLLIILVYVGVVFGREVISIFTSAKEAAFTGDAIGAVILFILGIYLIIRVNDIKTGAVFLDSAPSTRSPKRARRKGKRSFRR